MDGPSGTEDAFRRGAMANVFCGNGQWLNSRIFSRKDIRQNVQDIWRRESRTGSRPGHVQGRRGGFEQKP